MVNEHSNNNNNNKIYKTHIMFNFKLLCNSKYYLFNID